MELQHGANSLAKPVIVFECLNLAYFTEGIERMVVKIVNFAQL